MNRGRHAPRTNQWSAPTALRLMALALLLIGLAAITGGALAQGEIAFKVTPLNNSGVTGSGVTTPGASTEESIHTVQWQGLAPNSTHLVSQFHGTSCTNYESDPEFIFQTVTADSQGKAAARITVKKPFANWPRRPHMVVLHAGTELSTPAIACGYIEVPSSAAAPAAPTVPTMMPQTGWDPFSAFGLVTLSGFLLTAVGWLRRPRRPAALHHRPGRAPGTPDD